jgi:hypothetical protein
VAIQHLTRFAGANDASHLQYPFPADPSRGLAATQRTHHPGGQPPFPSLVGASSLPGCAAHSQDYTFTGRGEVYSFTTVYDAPAGFERYAPYVLALVKLEEGPLVTAQLTDLMPEEVEIGMSVEMVTRKLRTEGNEGMIIYGYKFRPDFGQLVQ